MPIQQWFLTVLKSGSTFDCKKNWRSTEIRKHADRIMGGMWDDFLTKEILNNG